MQDLTKICVEIDRLARKFLDLEGYGFKETARLGTTNYPWVIYNSEWCRLKIQFDGWEPPNQMSEFGLRIYYARLHAPNEDAVITWHGEECYCWHRDSNILNFLDGLSASEASSLQDFPQIIQAWQKSSTWQKLVNKKEYPELEVRLETTIWKHYGVRLFELFDLRRPDLWEKYRQFLKEYYDIKGRSPNIKPSLDQVC